MPGFDVFAHKCVLLVIHAINIKTREAVMDNFHRVFAFAIKASGLGICGPIVLSS